MQVEGLPRHARRFRDVGERDVGATSFHYQPQRCLADSLPGCRVAALST
jgi:hypothetical protein